MPVSYLEDEIDILVVYVIPEDTFHIFPVAVVSGRTHLTVYSNQHPKPSPFGTYRDNWEPLRA